MNQKVRIKLKLSRMLLVSPKFLLKLTEIDYKS